MKSKKNTYTITAFFCLAAIMLILYKSTPIKTNADFYTPQEIAAIMNMVRASKVYGTILEDCDGFRNYELNSKANVFSSGSRVEVLKDRNLSTYLVRENESSPARWIKAENIKIDSDPETNPNKISKEKLETYVNINKLESDTDYLIWTDIDRQLTYVFKGSLSNWELIKTFICATGKNCSPTTRGEFIIGERGEWFYSERLGSGAKYWLRFNGAYLFHSVAMDKNQNIIDGTLGQRRSSGCVRLSVSDSQWLYKNIPIRTKVYVN